MRIFLLFGVALLLAGGCHAALLHSSSSLPRVSTAGGHFLAGGALWVPRGLNYIRLNGSQGMNTDPLPVYHSTFSPLFYDASNATRALASACADGLGYNFIRVFIDEGTTTRGDGINGLPTGPQVLSDAYMSNVADFVARATSEGCYTMVTLGDVPQNAYWLGRRGAAPAWAAYPNTGFLAPGFVAAFADYAAAFASDLSARLGNDTSGLLTYSLANEGSYDVTTLPFASSTLVVQPADGGSYSMGDPAARQACADNGAVFWVQQVAAAVRAVDPATTVTVGMFTNQAVGKSGFNGMLPEGSDPRSPLRPADLSARSTLDWLDVHVYPFGTVVDHPSAQQQQAPSSPPPSTSPDWSLSSDLASSEWPLVNFTRMPVSMCETGAFKSFYATAAVAAEQLVSLQVLSCGHNFSGWGLWTYDTWEQGDFLWDGTDAEGSIANALSPLQRPRACV